MSYPDVPIWEKYTLTIEEAAKYFRIGETPYHSPHRKRQGSLTPLLLLSPHKRCAFVRGPLSSLF